MARRFFNTAFSLSMVTPPCTMQVVEITETEAAAFVAAEGVANVANPQHANTLQALSKRLGVDVSGAQGGRVALEPGDEVVVGQVSFPPSVPRETREYTDEQVASGKFSFLKVTVS